MATIFQHGTLELIMNGLYDGTTSLATILDNGDFGIGTLDRLNGELTIMNGKVYQTNAGGITQEIQKLELTTPFSSSHFEASNNRFVQEPKLSFSGLETLNHYVSQNVPNSLRLNGFFKSLKVRVAPKQAKPYPDFLSVSAEQPTFEYQNVEGTLIGDFGPDIYTGVMANGWHLHFLSNDFTIGGHVLDFSAEHLSGTVDTFDTVKVSMPIHNDSFMSHKSNISDIRQAIAKAEGE